MIETFKRIPNYPNYKVSNCGCVLSFRSNPSKLLSLNGLDRGGYVLVNLSNKGEQRVQKVHQLVWDAFGDRPRTDELRIDHKDENKQNNRIDNLQLLTNRENVTKYHQTKRDLPTGVVKHFTYVGQKKLYMSSIQVHRKIKYLGYYHTPEEASKAYQKALGEIQ